MAAIALTLIVVWIALVAGLRSYLQLRATGELGVGAHDPRGSPQWWSRRISTVGLLLAIAAPLAELAGVAGSAVLERAPLQVAGIGLFAVGIAVTLLSSPRWAPRGAPTSILTHAPRWSRPARSVSSATRPWQGRR